MDNKMLFVSSLTESERITLSDAHKYHPLSWTRIRAHCILLSDQKYEIKEIASILDICRQEVSNSIHNWETFGLIGLVDEYRSGRPKKLNYEEEEIVVKKVIASPRSTRKVLADLAMQGIEISLYTLRRICKAAKLSWKRVRKSLKYKRNEEDFERSKNIIKKLIDAHKKGEIKLRYFDESGFSLVPNVPYAWQKVGEYIELPSSRSKNISVLGVMSREGEFDSFVFSGTITTDVVIACLDEISEKCDINKPTVLIVDNAPIHTSYKFDQKTIEWCLKGLVVVPISKYSPELNLIEILWRRIKYEWLPFSAYNSLSSLKDELFNVLAGIGTTFNINFS